MHLNPSTIALLEKRASEIMKRGECLTTVVPTNWADMPDVLEDIGVAVLMIGTTLRDIAKELTPIGEGVTPCPQCGRSWVLGASKLCDVCQAGATS